MCNSSNWTTTTGRVDARRLEAVSISVARNITPWDDAGEKQNVLRTLVLLRLTFVCGDRRFDNCNLYLDSFFYRKQLKMDTLNLFVSYLIFNVFNPLHKLCARNVVNIFWHTQSLSLYAMSFQNVILCYFLFSRPECYSLFFYLHSAG